MKTTKQRKTERRRFAAGEVVWTKTCSGGLIFCVVQKWLEMDGAYLLESAAHGYVIQRDPWEVEAGGADEQSGASKQEPRQAVREQRLARRQCAELVDTAPGRLGRYVAQTTRQCRNAATVDTPHGPRCTRHARRSGLLPPSSVLNKPGSEK